MTSLAIASVVPLHSHPASAAAQRRAELRREAMRRHPAFLARQGHVALAEDAGHEDARTERGAVVCEFTRRRGEMTPPSSA